LIGALGIPPSEIDWMTPREVTLAMHGYRQAEKARWARALRISQTMGDEMTVDHLFPESGEQPGRQMTQQDYQDLKAFFDDDAERTDRTGGGNDAGP
jgi:hypothetical protein